MSPAQLEAALRRAATDFAANRLDDAHRLAMELWRAAPGDFHVQHLIGAIAARQGRWEECVAASTAALALRPDQPEALANRGAALRMLGRFEAALADYDRAIAVSPRSPEAHNNRGVALAALNRHGEAIEAYRRALQLNPAYARARFNLAMSELVTGDFGNGWRDHEARWTGSEMHRGPRALPWRTWDGHEDLEDKRLLLYAEQGLGDTLQFARYATLAARRGARVILEVHAPLARLLGEIEGVETVVPLGQPLPDFDLHVALMSMPLAFGTTLETIPADIPYIHAARDKAGAWRDRLRDARSPRVGLAWSGSRTLRNDANRSIALDRLAPLAATGATLVAVQTDIREGDRAALDRLGVLTFDDELRDFSDTAALIDSLDLVITVDTAAAHLAGAMGKPAWVMLPFSPDWRWLLDREDSPWYPSARLFRQPRIGDWDTVVDNVGSALANL